MSVIREFKVKAIKNKRVMVESFNSASEVVQVSGNRQITDRQFNNMETKELNEGWHGVKDFKEALHLMETGYQPTVEKFKASIKANFAGQGKRISFHNDIVGYAPIVPLAIQGVPTSMQNSYMKPIKAKVIDVYYDMTASCWHDADDFIKAGSELLAAIIELEAQGYKFNLYALQSYYRDDADVLCVKIKSSNTPIDLKRISFPLTHPAFFRVIGFDWYSKTPKGKYRIAYGKAIGYEFSQEELTNAFTEMFGNKCVFFSCSKIMGQSKDYLKEVLTNGETKKKN